MRGHATMPEQTAKRPVGRPSLHGAAGDSPVFRVRVDPRQLERLRAVAAERRTTPSALVRQALDEIVG